MDTQFTPYLEQIEKELKAALPLLPDQSWKTASFGQLSPFVQDVHLAPLISPTRTLVALGGKRWRPLFLVLCAEAELEAQKTEGANSKAAISTAYHLTPLVEFVHTASLIHDDIEDRSDTRRGEPAAYITYGTDTAINAGAWLYFEAPVCIDTSTCSLEQKERLYAAYAQELRRLHLGQAMDIAWHRDNNACPSVEEYFAMVRSKTGTLASLSARIGILAADGTPAVADTTARIAADIGAGFQIIDDVINLTSGNPGKKRGDDVVEGKKSLPVLMFLEQHKNDKTSCTALTTCFKQAHDEGIDSVAVEQTISILSKSGVISQAAAKGSSLISEGCMEMEKLFGHDNKTVQKIRTLFTGMIPSTFTNKLSAEGALNA
jgi:octaprenyl-diphosphate synthase